MSICSTCGKPMPAGRGKTCEACAWEKTFRKRLDIDCAGFGIPSMADIFASFGEWLLQHTGSHKAALTIHRYFPFFLEMENTWGMIPDYAGLLAHFGAEGLRCMRQPMRWLSKECGVIIDPEIRESDSERRRIEANLATFCDGTASREALTAYQKKLKAKSNGSLSALRSMRLSLSPATSLLLETDPSGNKLPEQHDLDCYLLKSPGQKASVTGFVNYLNNTYGTNLTPRVDEKLVRTTRRRALEKKLMRMASMPEDNSNFMEKWIDIGLRYFHNITKKKPELRVAKVKEAKDGGLNVYIDGHIYWLPKIDSISDEKYTIPKR